VGIVYRRVTEADIANIAAFAIAGLRAHLYPLWVSTEKVLHVVRHFINTKRDFQLAAFDGDQIVGAIGAVVTEMLFFERCEATVLIFRATQPGVGAALILEMQAWADEDMRIRRVQFPCEFDATRAMPRYLRMHGFTRQQVLAVAYKE
jgi:hypothetical protein